MPRFNHVILDRDGVLNEEGPGGYVTKPSQWKWMPGALDTLSVLARAGICLSIATNQSCVGRGIIDIAGLDRVHGKMTADAARQGIYFDGIYYCPHRPDAGCRCRKPMPGLLETAICKTGIPAIETVFIGDAATDLQCARAAGITAWMVRTGKGKDTETMLRQGEIPRIVSADIRVFDDLTRVCDAVLSDSTVYEKG
jgi:D-glycero-D-manno-heptose 1,7-bisphosphate phosphatase